MSPAENTISDNMATRYFRSLMKKTNDFLHMGATGGIFLLVATILALIVANTPLNEHYDHILNSIKFRIGFDDLAGTFDYEIKKSILLWVNDGLMAIFFFLVGLEIKREVVKGKLSRVESASLPLIAAVGGIAVPALIYFFMNKDIPANVPGWAIPSATDIAFALGVLALLGSRVPVGLKVLLTAIAIIDDIAAILIIAFFYSGNIFLGPLYVAGVALLILLALNRLNVVNVVPYILIGMIIWVAVLKSGVHATIAGVLTALFIPTRCNQNPDIAPCRKLETALHPWVVFLVLPIFAFSNAGVPLAGMTLDDVFDPMTLGIIAGLFIGKQVGVFGTIWLAIKSGLTPMPENTNWGQLYAVSVLCGIGFTMSLFIGGLAFDGLDKQVSLRLGVLIGSVLSAVYGYFLMRHFTREAAEEKASESS